MRVSCLVGALCLSLGTALGAEFRLAGTLRPRATPDPGDDQWMIDLKCTRSVKIRNCTTPGARPHLQLKNSGAADASGWEVRRSNEKITRLGQN